MEDGELILIDEVLTPDSSRFKISKENETGLNAGYYDKQIVRDVLTNEKKYSSTTNGTQSKCCKGCM